MNTYGVCRGHDLWIPRITIPPQWIKLRGPPTNSPPSWRRRIIRGRFGIFAFLPMPHIDTTLKEIEYVCTTRSSSRALGMYTNYGDKWLGDSYFDPVFEELQPPQRYRLYPPHYLPTAAKT